MKFVQMILRSTNSMLLAKANTPIEINADLQGELGGRGEGRGHRRGMVREEEQRANVKG